MTAFAKDIAAVQQLLPVRIGDRRSDKNALTIVDRNGWLFCLVPIHSGTEHSRAAMIVSAINALSDSLVPSRSHHGL